MMRIKKVDNVLRDENGFWTHPDFPDWDEGTAVEVIDEWLAINKINYNFIEFVYDADIDLVDAWLDAGCEYDCSEWEPIHVNPNAFLLSIQYTEEGPVAMFAIPYDEADEK